MNVSEKLKIFSFKKIYLYYLFKLFGLSNMNFDIIKEDDEFNELIIQPSKSN